MGFLGPCLVMDMGNALNEGDRRERGEHNQCPRKDGGVGCESCDEGGEQGHEESFWAFSDPDIAIKPQPRHGHARRTRTSQAGDRRGQQVFQGVVRQGHATRSRAQDQ